MISIYVAMAENRAIGKKNDIPWRLSADMKRLSKTTRGHTVLMGRKTHESILSRLGKPLPERRTIVITRQKEYAVPEGCAVAHSFNEAVKMFNPEEETFVFGGAEVYNMALPYTDRIYLTKVHAVVDGDAFFPELNEREWILQSEEKCSKDEKNECDYTFTIYERKQ